tara:strand:+ start:1179 stop:1493 length:315 start_codon:yes stop_codon:yes gene_type:complete
MTKLKDIKEFNMLQRNLELTKALQDVDRLKAENLELKQKNNVWESDWQTLVNENERLRAELNEVYDEIVEREEIEQTNLDHCYNSPSDKNDKAQEEAERLKSKL